MTHPNCEHGKPLGFCETCDQPAAITHPLEAPDTLAKLALIPTLAALVTDTPHREQRQKLGKPGKLIASPMPNAIRARDLLADITRLLGEAVRVTCEDMTADQLGDHPLTEQPTIAGDSAWLTETEPIWNRDPLTREWVTSNVNQAHRALAVWCNELPTQPPVYRCLADGCAGRLHRDRYADVEGQQYACEDCGKIYHPADIAHLAVWATPVDLPTLAAMLSMTERTLQRWVVVGLVTPFTRHTPSPRRPALFLPTEAARVRAVVRVA